MPLVELARFPDRISAELARGRLAVDGIEAALFEEGMAVLGLDILGSIRLMVDEDDCDRAEATLGA